MKRAIVLLAIISAGCTAAKIGTAVGILGAGVRIIGGLPSVPPPPCVEPNHVWSDEAKGCVPVTPTVAPTATSSPGAPIPTPTLTPPPPLPTSTPGAVTPAPPPTLPPPAAGCAIDPGPEPVSIRQVPRCMRGYEPLDFQDDPTLCGVKAGSGDSRTAWRLGYGVFRQNLTLAMVHGNLLQYDEGRGYVDATGRYFPDGIHLYEHPEGPTAPYSHGGYVVPAYCSAATPAPTPGATPLPGTSDECARAISMNAHFLVGGGGCHAASPTGDGRVKCVLDSTLRPICDPEHQDNWNDPNLCGRCSHDPDYNSPAGAQIWTIDGAEDRGPNPNNSAQRIIVGRPRAQVLVTICPAKPVIAAATGTELPIRGDGCSRPEPFTMPNP